MQERNLGMVEQAVRMVVGSLASLSGIVLLAPGKASLASGAVGVVLVIAGLYLFVTGSAGYCPIYNRLGWTTWRAEGQQDGTPIDRWRQSEHDSGVSMSWRHRVLMVLYCLPLIAVVAWMVLRVRGL
jgi:hypothetical protein